MLVILHLLSTDKVDSCKPKPHECNLMVARLCDKQPKRDRSVNNTSSREVRQHE